MTDSIDLSELSASDTARRDQWGRYLVLPPGAAFDAKPEGYTRATTIAKVLDSGGGLANWRAAMTATGMLMRPGLLAQWQALMGEFSNPWYDTDKSKAECKRLVGECATVGGANDRAEQGTALHTLTALVDLGRPPTHLAEDMRADIAAYQAGMAAADISIVPGFVETVVVLDTYKVAGTFDRLLHVPGFELPLIGDLKTGRDLSYSWQSIAVQLAIYSRGDAVYKQGAADNGQQDERQPMPVVDQEHGMILWLNAGSGQLEFYVVDLAAGWQAFERSMWTYAWRKATPGHRWEPPSKLEQDLTASVRLWLQRRIDRIGERADARTDLVTRWPAAVPTLKTSATHTADQLAVIQRLLDDVEARHQLPFEDPAPGADTAEAKVLELFPGTTPQQPKGAS